MPIKGVSSYLEMRFTRNLGHSKIKLKESHLTWPPMSSSAMRTTNPLPNISQGMDRSGFSGIIPKIKTGKPAADYDDDDIGISSWV